MGRDNPYELTDDDDAEVPEPPGRDRDGVASLHDIEAEAGDEEEIIDKFDMDDRAAREAGVALDERDEPEPGLR
jgi:hypothetical protein